MLNKSLYKKSICARGKIGLVRDRGKERQTC